MLKGSQYVIFFNENNHKINLNIDLFGVFFSLMINMRVFFNFSLIILCFMLLKTFKIFLKQRIIVLRDFFLPTFAFLLTLMNKCESHEPTYKKHMHAQHINGPLHLYIMLNIKYHKSFGYDSIYIWHLCLFIFGTNIT